MKPVPTPFSNHVFVLPGGTDENNLPVEMTHDVHNQRCIVSMWEPTDEERKRISEGENIRLVVWDWTHPAVALAVGDITEEERNEENVEANT